MAALLQGMLENDSVGSKADLKKKKVVTHLLFVRKKSRIVA